MQLDLFAEPDICSGKTSPAPSQATADQTLLLWLERWLGPISLCQKLNGKKPALVADVTDWSSGVCLTLNMCEWNHIPEQSPSDVDVCSLSSILETGPVEHRYFLSPKACTGILRRADNRGKSLPPSLRAALEAVALDPTLTATED